VNVCAGLMHDKLIRPFFFSEKTDRTFVIGHAGAVYSAPVTTLNCPLNKMGRRHISATMLGITWTER
jgi:hypothetical protein